MQGCLYLSSTLIETSTYFISKRMASYNPCASFQHELDCEANEQKKDYEENPEASELKVYSIQRRNAWFERSKQNKTNTDIWSRIEKEFFPDRSEGQQLEYQ